LKGLKDSPTGDGTDATDQPGLKEMTLKAIDILQARSKGQGWFMMFVPENFFSRVFTEWLDRSEAASIDKMMHALDYERALGELLELDDTVRATIARQSPFLFPCWLDLISGRLDLKTIGEFDDTLIVVTADHGHGFVCDMDLLTRMLLIVEYCRMSLEVPIPNTSLRKSLIGRRGVQVSPSSLLERWVDTDAKYSSWCLL